MMGKFQFPADFIWGAATASYQIEGAVNEDGRGDSIWDRFSHTPGKIANNDTGDVACDHYHRFKTDVSLMKEMGLKGYRFSIAWPRIFPEGKGRLNPKGLDFYNALVDELLENGIDPLVTLYHWDLPQALQERGGWDNRDTIDYFAEYTRVVFEALGDRVHRWITFNEPFVSSFYAHADGQHAPGFRDYSLATRVSHHQNLAHAKAVQIYRSMKQKGEIGITLNLSAVYPASGSPEDKASAIIADGYFNRWFLDPVLKGNYPEDMFRFYQEKFGAPVVQNGDMELLAAAPIDFLGINYYSRSVVRKPSGLHVLGFEGIAATVPCTGMGWEIYPEGLYDLLTRVDRDYHHPKIYITENGAAFDDRLIDKTVEDPERIAYLNNHFTAAHRAIAGGVDLAGYFVWSLMDNFEWAFGYAKRFGLIYIDYPTQQRIWKDSARWYRDVIKNNGF